MDGMKIDATFETRVNVSENGFADDRPLVAVMRGEHAGSLHRGIFAVADVRGNVLASLGDSSQPVYLRSAAKPFQVMPAIVSGGIDRFGITPPELAVLCASHSGEPSHQEAVLSVLAKIGLDESALQCGIHPPLHEATAQHRWRHGLEPSPACNNCSGAHTGMLLACRARGWPIDNYGSPNHPLQQETRTTLGIFAGVESDSVDIAMDNCHVPTFRLPIRRAAVAFARLAAARVTDEGLQRAAASVVAAMTAHPEMVGGEARFDTDLMSATSGRIVAKSGAEGFQGLGFPAPELGIALKITDGNARAVGPASVHLLQSLGLLDDLELQRLQQWHRPATVDLQGAVTGHLIPVFGIERPA